MLEKNIDFLSLITGERSDYLNVCLGRKVVEKMLFALAKKAVIYYNGKNDQESSMSGNEQGRK